MYRVFVSKIKQDSVYQGELFSSHMLNNKHTPNVLVVSNAVYLLATLMPLHDDLLPKSAMSLILNAASVLNLHMG